MANSVAAETSPAATSTLSAVRGRSHSHYPHNENRRSREERSGRSRSPREDDRRPPQESTRKSVLHSGLSEDDGDGLPRAQDMRMHERLASAKNEEWRARQRRRELVERLKPWHADTEDTEPFVAGEFEDDSEDPGDWMDSERSDPLAELYGNSIFFRCSDCGREGGEAVMMGCTHCHRTFHPECAGFKGVYRGGASACSECVEKYFRLLESDARKLKLEKKARKK